MNTVCNTCTTDPVVPLTTAKLGPAVQIPVHYQLRTPKAEDAEALATIRAQAMKPSLEAIGRFDEGRARRRILDAFDPDVTQEIWVGEERVGFLVVRRLEDHWYLDHLYITAAHQGAGLGSAVLRELIQKGKVAKLPVRLGALKLSPSNRFYASHGFHLEREEEWDNYYVLPPGAA
jgi:ribosomal protein S18 acetylase RimI-like enzyme